MKKLLALVVIAFCSCSMRAQQNYGITGYKVNGQLVASQYAQWSISSQMAQGPFSFPPFLAIQSLEAGRTFIPFSTVCSILITDPTPGTNETVTPSQVQINTSFFTLSLTTAHTHLSYTLTSGTGGLCEAWRDLGGAAGQILVTQEFFDKGFTTSTISAFASNLLAGQTITDLVHNVQYPINLQAITGTGTASHLAAFTSAQVLAATDLTGDTTTSGSSATTTAKVNGVAYPSAPSTHQVAVVTASNTATYKTVPDCQDSAGNHINYTQSTDAFSCGTSTAGAGGPAGGDLSGSYPNPTVAKVNGVVYSSSPSTNTVPVVTASNTATYETMPDCQDASGVHLNFTQSSHTFSCGVTTGNAPNSIYPTFVKPVSGNFTITHTGTGSTILDKTNRLVVNHTGSSTDIVTFTGAALTSQYTIDICASMNGQGANVPIDIGPAVIDDTNHLFAASWLEGVNLISTRAIHVTNYNNGGTVSSATIAGPLGMITSNIACVRLTDDTTHRTYWYSSNGLDYVQYAQENTNTFVTPVKAGFALAQGSNTSDDSVVTYHYAVATSVLPANAN